MPLCDFVDEEQSPPLVKRVFDSLRKQGFRVVNAHRVMAHNPEVLRHMDKFSHAVADENILSNRIKELAILKVSLVNGCHY